MATTGFTTNVLGENGEWTTRTLDAGHVSLKSSFAIYLHFVLLNILQDLISVSRA